MNTIQRLHSIRRRRRNPPESQLPLFVIGGDLIKKPGTLEERAASHPVANATPIPPINNFPSYRVTFEELASFRSRPKGQEQVRVENYRGIQKVWYGLNNMETLDGRFGVPHEMLIREIPFEIVAMYLGIGVAKVLTAHGQSKIYKLILDELGKDFGSGVNQLVNIGRQYNGVNVMANKRSNQIRTVPLTERIQSLPEDVRETFINSFKLPYRVSGSEHDKNFPYAFRDPHPENTHDLRGIDAYRRHIGDFMLCLYTRNRRT